ncbi:MAG: choice-of-anchor Q domain-containing protein [Dokdonella sp.]
MLPLPRWFRASVPFTLFALGCSPASAGTTVWTWPGPSPCNTTLQACIDHASSSEIVEIASNGPITEPINIFGKSLNLRPASGFSPVFQAGPSSSNAIDVFGADTLVGIVIEGMTVRDGTITAYARGSGSFYVTIRDNVVEAAGLDANRTAIAIRPFGTNPTGDTHFTIMDNEIDLGFLQGDDIAAIGVDDLPGPTTGVIEGNAILDGGTWSTRGAIRMSNGAGTAEVDVRYNRIQATGYYGGIVLVQEGAAGTFDAHVVNNLVTGTIDITGPQPGAISLLATAGNLHATVLGNTLAGNDTGFIATASAGANLTGSLANTLVADNSVQGVVIGATIAAGFANDHNLVFGNGADDFTAGPGTIHADPQFVGAGDFHPRGNSPVRDAGNTAWTTDIPTDLDGAPRVIGSAVDVGAWELADSIFADGFDGP